MAARNGIAVQSDVVFGSTSAGGGISNSGVISAPSNAILVTNVTGFAGGISNSGTISGNEAIFVFNDASFAGGVTNSGLLVQVGGGGSGIGFATVNVVSGGIANGGTIRAASTGVSLETVSTFVGDITNSKSGTISAGIGINLGFQGVNPVASFIGNIVNSGTITARTGISISDSTIVGAIVDSGTIVATSHGILIDGLGKVLASKTAIAIAGPTFIGGITNFGVISGSAGIEIRSAKPVSIFDGGVIIGTGGTAIQFAGSGNTLTLGAGYAISGIVDPSGKNTLQLGGTGSATFNLGSIGPAAQYRGFTTFNVIGGAWTVTGASTAHWTVKGGALEVASGVTLTSTTVSGGGTLDVESGGTASSTFIAAGGAESRIEVPPLELSRAGTPLFSGLRGIAPGEQQVGCSAKVGVRGAVARLARVAA
jgi:autotransporter passenger strand-loop-strand repeat protein